MTFDKDAWQLAQRREAGIGPAARCDPALDVQSLVRAGGFASENALGAYIRLSGSTMKLARERGLTIWTADKYAARLGLHPWEVWGETWWESGARHEARGYPQRGPLLSYECETVDA